MDRQQIESSVLAVIAAVLKGGVGRDCSRENTPRWDSLKHIEIVFAVEDELGVQFSEEELARLDSVAKIVDVAVARHAP